MKFVANDWKDTLKEIQAKLPSLDPSSGTLCAIASAVQVRDWLTASPKINSEAAEVIEAEFKELIASLATEKLGGFASNASAAAKFAELDKAKKQSVDVSNI